jgi:hypothetical protein
MARRLSPDMTGVATDAHCPQRAEGEAHHECDEIIKGWGGKHQRTPEAGSPVRNRSGGAAGCCRAQAGDIGLKKISIEIVSHGRKFG